ncbi:unnamed protein product, partial [Iphiclides podalirius]
MLSKNAAPGNLLECLIHMYRDPGDAEKLSLMKSIELYISRAILGIRRDGAGKKRPRAPGFDPAGHAHRYGRQNSNRYMCIFNTIQPVPRAKADAKAAMAPAAPGDNRTTTPWPQLTNRDVVRVHYDEACICLTSMRYGGTGSQRPRELSGPLWALSGGRKGPTEAQGAFAARWAAMLDMQMGATVLPHHCPRTFHTTPDSVRNKGFDESFRAKENRTKRHRQQCERMPSAYIWLIWSANEMRLTAAERRQHRRHHRRLSPNNDSIAAPSMCINTSVSRLPFRFMCAAPLTWRSDSHDPIFWAHAELSCDCNQ